jgi:hypothetical protein
MDRPAIVKGPGSQNEKKGLVLRMQKGPGSRNAKRACVLKMQKELVFSKCKRSSTAELAIEVPVMLSGASRISIMDGKNVLKTQNT